MTVGDNLPCRTVYVGNLPVSLKRKQLKTLFKQ
jgi:RNA recognition motif-containing protein